MKKFGTPTGAGPGSDSEKLGFDALGTPAPVGSGVTVVLVGVVAPGLPAFFVAFGFCFFFAGGVEGVAGAGAGCDDGCWPWLLIDGAGVVEERGVVADEEELVEEREGEVDVELWEVVVGLAEEVVDDEPEAELELELDDAGAHDSLSDCTGWVIGSDIWEIGVPGGTLTLNVYV